MLFLQHACLELCNMHVQNILTCFFVQHACSSWLQSTWPLFPDALRGDPVSEIVESSPGPSQPARSASWTVRSPDECTLVSRFLLKPVVDDEGGLAQSRCCRLLAWAKDGTTGGASERSWSLSVLSALIVVASYPSQRYTKFVSV